MENDSGTSNVMEEDPPITQDEKEQPVLAETISEPRVCGDASSGTENGVALDADAREDVGTLDVEEVCAATGSDSGVEGCGGRALSSGGGSRSCASSVVSCGSGCGSESSSLAGAPPRPRRRLTVTVTEPRRTPPATSTPRPATTPRAPSLATRERARSREKPAIPDKPRPITPKPRIRPTADLPNLVRESPALRAKPTKTSAARCRTPNSPSEEKRWPATVVRMPIGEARGAADKYGTMPRRRRDDGDAGSPRHDITPPTSRRSTLTRSTSTRSATKSRVRIYAEKTMQTVLVGSDIEAALGGIMPNIECRTTTSRCDRGVQASGRDGAAAAVAAAEAAAAAERERRELLEAQLADERAARLAAHQELERNSNKLLELAGAAGAGAGSDGCLRALEEQLRAAGALAAQQRQELDALRKHCDTLQQEVCSSRESSRSLAARLTEAEREACEMQDFLAAETGALSDSLREAEADATALRRDLDRSRGECRQLVRMCEQRRQEALAAAARARPPRAAAAALTALAARLTHHTQRLTRGGELGNHAFSRSDSADALSPEEDIPKGGLLAAVTRALRIPLPVGTLPLTHTAQPLQNGTPHDDRSHQSDDNSADLLDSETEPCLVTDPDCADEWISGADYGTGAWSGEELSPVRDEMDPEESSVSERESLRNLSAAIAHRQRSEAEDPERGSLLDKVMAVDNALTEFLRALKFAATASDDVESVGLANALKEKLEVTDKNVADVVVRKLAEIDANKGVMEHYRNSVEVLKNQLAQNEEENIELLEEELASCTEQERRSLYNALDCALCALERGGGTRLCALRAILERIAFALVAAPGIHSSAAATTPSTPLHGTA